MSFLAWIDFDQADRDRTRRIMDLFGQEDSRDELGLGSVRDTLADLMFPGTSTIQTRLRYMFFVPWIYQIAGQNNGTASIRQELARGLEFRLIEALINGGETQNVIGQEARETLKRLPSDVYWAGLYTLGIRKFHGSRNACFEASPGEARSLWAAGMPAAPDDFLETLESTVTFALTPYEAGFIRDRLTHQAPKSLLTLLAREETAPDCDMIWQHPRRADWPADVTAIVDHAHLFSDLMHGASLLYNLMLCDKAATMQGSYGSAWHDRSENYAKRLEDWAQSLQITKLVEWDLSNLWDLSRDTIHKVKPPTSRFIETWRDIVVRSKGLISTDTEARALIKDREMRLKGGKSRFRNEGALMRWRGASGTAPLNYRWQPVVSNHIKDLVDAG